ncbi:tyrosinase cofactor [Streptomyces sp. NPDC028635]|uniref:tyrosinase cofactor n=1 Tax=Streptomyces sp. NPDC028635 TaxID=3154800 RepID=UPI0033E89D1A
MVVSVGQVTAKGEGVAAPARPGPLHGTRREVLRGLLVPAVALAFTPALAAWPRHAADGDEGTAFDETYRGRRIQGVKVAGARAFDTGQWQVTVDGRPLHLMRRADGTWLSMVDHYRSYPTPLEATRAAVDALGPGQQLRATPLSHGGRGGHEEHGGQGEHAGRDHMGGDHGVHA